MNPSPSKRSGINRRQVRAEAAAWIARLHGPDRARELEAGFRRWLAERPEHAAEFELATDIWSETAGISIPASQPLSGQRRTVQPNRALWRIAAGLAACLLGAVWIAHILGRSVVTTRVGEQDTISLADGSRVSLNTNSRIIVQYGQHTRTVILKYGEAYFQVVHNQARPFIVRVGDQKVIDIGTSFMVRRDREGEGSLIVTVIAGRVAVAPIDVPDILPKVRSLNVLFVSAGNRLLMRPQALPSIQEEPAEQATAWLRGQLVFNDTALGDAADQFNRYNTVKIIVSASQLDKIRVGGVFRTGAAESFARSVAQTHDLRLIVHDDTLVLEPGTSMPGGR